MSFCNGSTGDSKRFGREDRGIKIKAEYCGGTVFRRDIIAPCRLQMRHCYAKTNTYVYCIADNQMNNFSLSQIGESFE